MIVELIATGSRDPSPNKNQELPTSYNYSSLTTNHPFPSAFICVYLWL